MEARDYIDLLELQTRIKESIADAFPGKYWVKAEIASWIKIGRVQTKRI